MDIFVYVLIAAGCEAAGVGIWRSLVWPVMLGRLIGRAAGEVRNG